MILSHNVPHQPKLRTLSVFGLCLLWLTGCAGLSPIPLGGAAAQTVEEQTPAPQEFAEFEPETLYSLLVAEFAGQRKRYDILISNYLHEAEKTGDVGVAERATRLATYLKADRAALKAAQLWVKAAPHSVDAKQALAVHLVKAKRFEEALTVSENTLAHGGRTKLPYLAINTKDITPTQRADILREVNELLAQYPDDTSLLFGKTLLLKFSGRPQEALEAAKRLHKIQHDTDSMLHLARLYHESGKSQKALQALRKALNRHPEDKQIRLLYGQLLIDQKQLDQAYVEFATLVDQFPADGRLRMTLSLIGLELKRPDEAQTHLDILVKQGQQTEDAHYYLGQIAEKAGDTVTAVKHYGKVLKGNKMLPAHSRIGDLLIKGNEWDKLHQVFERSRALSAKESKALYGLEADLLTKHQQVDAAIQLLTDALTTHTDDTSLLYARAMAAEKTNNLEAMEKDLRKILGIQPNNATALNALGYTLADRTTRYEEALALISRANEIKPNDPAITDSLGWAMYRLGNYPEAIKLLEKALAEFPDQEVAAHLGEVLWAAGERERAHKVWQDALQRSPDSPILKRVIQRLSPKQVE